MDIEKDAAEINAAGIRYLRPEDAGFSLTGGGFVSLAYNGETYKRVNLSRAFPFSEPDEFISVRDPDNKEIGIIRYLSDFDGETQKLIRRQMKLRYFTPVILKINKVTEEFGYTYWDTLTDIGGCRFTVRNERSSFIRLAGDRVIINDIDGNRYDLPDLDALDRKSFRKIELYL